MKKMNSYSSKLLQNLEQLLLEQLSRERKKYTMFINTPWKKCKIDQKEKIRKKNLMAQFRMFWNYCHTQDVEDKQ
jgi:hypothetical protein